MTPSVIFHVHQSASERVSALKGVNSLKFRKGIYSKREKICSPLGAFFFFPLEFDCVGV